MKPPVKTLALLTIFFLLTTPSHSQIRLSSAGSIAADITRVINDYPNHFTNIMGELITTNPQSTDYSCTVKVAGAEECTITRYTGKNKTISSWQATMQTTESFNQAKRKFRALFDQLNNLPNGAMYLKGVYEAPAEEKKFTSVVFSFSPPDESVKKLRVELVLEAQVIEWKIKILVYDIQREDEERGEIIEN